MRTILSLLFFAAALAPWPGCMVPVTQLNSAQAVNRALTAQNDAQLTEIENLKTHARKVEDRLQDAETQLAKYEEQRALDGAQLAKLNQERTVVGEEIQKLSYIPRPLPDSVRQQMTRLSQRYPSMRFDPETGVGKLDCDVLFDSGSVALKAGARDALVRLARELKSPDGDGLRVMVVGHTDDQAVAKRPVRDDYPDNFHLSAARALAVADCLREAGLSEDRMGVAGMGGHEPIVSNDSEKDRHRNRRVEIFVLANETPVVGWTETTPALYR